MTAHRARVITEYGLNTLGGQGFGDTHDSGKGSGVGVTPVGNDLGSGGSSWIAFPPQLDFAAPSPPYMQDHWSVP